MIIEKYIIENGIVSKIRTPKGFKFGTSHKVGKDIYLYVQKSGLFKISNKNLELVKGTENFNTKKKSIVYINKQGNSLKIVTRGSGIYVLKNNIAKKIIEKNLSIRKNASDCLISADTIIAVGSRIIGKPKSIDHAKECLQLLSGRRHRVYSAVTVSYLEKHLTDTVCTFVQFKRLSSLSSFWNSHNSLAIISKW